MLNLIPIIIISHQNSYLFYPPDSIPQEYTSCNPISRKLSIHHITYSNNHLRGNDNLNDNLVDSQYNNDCPTQRGVCSQKKGKDEWKCICHPDFYNLNKTSTKPCYNTRYYKDCIIIMTVIFGWTPITALIMGWNGLFLLSLFILIWVIILIIVKYCGIGWGYHPTKAYYNNNISNSSNNSNNNTSNIYKYVCYLSFIIFISVWIYTIFLTFNKPVNHLGIPNV